MKNIFIDNKECKFKNEELFKVAELAKSKGYKIHTFNPSGFYINQIFIDNGKTFGSVSEQYSGVSYSTCHKSKQGSGLGSGFGVTGHSVDVADPKLLGKIFLSYPASWCKGEVKKETWNEYLQRETILKYTDITDQI